MTNKTRRCLKRAEAIRLSFGPEFEAERWSLLGRLSGWNLPSAPDLERLHELLCFARAWPDSPRILRLARAELRRFGQRVDLRRFRERLSDSGIAGTELRYRFFHPTARWLARRWPEHVHVDWAELEDQDALLSVMRLMGVFAERQGLSILSSHSSQGHSAQNLVEEMRRPSETDAAFLLVAFDDLRMGERVRETQYDALELPLLLSAGETTPSRTTAALPAKTVYYQREPLSEASAKSSERLDVAGGLPIRLRRLSRRRANRVVDLARGALATRLRDLDPIAYADVRDVQLAECGRGFEIAVLGVIPERRFLLECEHGFLMLKNGVPIGYGCTWALFGSCQLNFNLFPTFRGSEAAWLYARACALFRQMYDCDTFVVEPYQLGDENEEAIESGAWWFYAKRIPTPAGERAADRARRAGKETTAGGVPHAAPYPTATRVGAHVSRLGREAAGCPRGARAGGRRPDRRGLHGA